MRKTTFVPVFLLNLLLMPLHLWADGNPQTTLEHVAPKGMVFIPAGTFPMGSLPEDEEAMLNEQPQHAVTLDAFFLDMYEVTNRQFQEFVKEKGFQTMAEKEGHAYTYTNQGEWEEIEGANWRKPEGTHSVFTSGREEHPVVSVSWDDAHTYCQGVGKRLPTEAEWEYAARAGTQTNFWWGNRLPEPSNLVANLADRLSPNAFRKSWALDTYEDGFVRTAPVGSYKPNAFGLYDMAGNVGEWVADWYGFDYYEMSPEKNPRGPSDGTYKIIRGGAWDFEPTNLRSADRNVDDPWNRSALNGFRCAKDIKIQ